LATGISLIKSGTKSDKFSGYSLFDQSKGHRVTKVLAFIGSDTADDDHNQAEYHQCKDEKKSNDDKAQRN
jgi:hypothetical protein